MTLFAACNCDGPYITGSPCPVHGFPRQSATPEVITPVIRTYTGREVNPLDLRPEDIVIDDIAHHLALLNRFVGATKRPVNIAQHSVYVCRIARHFGTLADALQGLFHDGPEAYLGDVSKWVKMHPSMETYREAEDRAQRVIFGVVGCPLEITDHVERADRMMVRFEGQHRYGLGKEFRVRSYPELTTEELEVIGNWSPWTWRQSEDVFMAEYNCLRLAMAEGVKW